MRFQKLGDHLGICDKNEYESESYFISQQKWQKPLLTIK